MIKQMFTGRIGRWNYFLGGIVWAVLTGLFVAVVISLMAGASYSVGESLGGGATAIFFLAIFVAAVVLIIGSLSLGVRRLHDLGWEGWWILLNFVPIANFILGLILLFKPGELAPNAYGVPPAATMTVKQMLLNK